MIKELLKKPLTLKKRLGYICCIVLLIFMMDCIVYAAGGTGSAFTHLLYIPIIISAFVFVTTVVSVWLF
jgi:hypothetical protein